MAEEKQIANAEEERVIFTKEMKESYTILVPMMLPIHFKLLQTLFAIEGFHLEIIDTRDHRVIDKGLKYTHNDICYPAQLTIGQLMDALDSGKYDKHKVALMLMQTGGGCRASNYVRLLRKALKKADLAYIPVVSLNYTGMEKDPGFDLSLKFIFKLIKAIVYGDLLMCLRNQLLPYEEREGSVDSLSRHWCDEISEQFKEGKGLAHDEILVNMDRICRSFSQIKVTGEEKIKVGIVGEIYVKFAPLGNNNLEDFLHKEGAEVVVPGLLDFLLYTIDTHQEDRKLYGHSKAKAMIFSYLVKKFSQMQAEMNQAIAKYPNLRQASSFAHTKELAQGYIHYGVKMGEGWLLTAEMLELLDSGVNNIVCTQPFGCLPNHICGRGMIRKIKEGNPGANIVAIDYDASATKVNQENRLKLMLATGRNLAKAQ